METKRHKNCHYWIVICHVCCRTAESLECNYCIVPLIISPNEVFGDIMVLALPPPPRPPPVDPDDVSIQPISFIFYMRVDTPLRFFAIEI